MNQRVAELLCDDRSIDAFMLTCRSTHAAIEGNGRSFWRRRFLATFEKPLRSKSNNEFKTLYLQRRLSHFRRVTFTTGENRAEKECLRAIRDIIVGQSQSIPCNFALTDPLQSLTRASMKLLCTSPPTCFTSSRSSKPVHHSSVPSSTVDPRATRLIVRTQIMVESSIYCKRSRCC